VLADQNKKGLERLDTLGRNDAHLKTLGLEYCHNYLDDTEILGHQSASCRMFNSADMTTVWKYSSAGIPSIVKALSFDG